jgi:tetraacyldisaccharide 4'-kinase
VKQAAEMLLLPFGWIYGRAMATREKLYRDGKLESFHPAIPVYCVGNLTLGGTGKTPVVIALTKELCRLGRKPAIISRGYRRDSAPGQLVVAGDGIGGFSTVSAAGDEPALMARTLPEVPVIVCADRVAACEKVIGMGTCDCVIMDDGFQHLRLQRDADFVLIDSTVDLGRLRVFPAGTLREGLSALRRAAAVIHTRCEQQQFLDRNRQVVESIGHDIPQFKCEFHMEDGFYPLSGEGKLLSVADLSQKRVLAFAGIAHPGPFFSALEAQGITLQEKVSLPDHAHYSREQLARLLANCDVAITTEKDAVKLREIVTPETRPIYFARQQAMLDDWQKLLAIACGGTAKLPA